MSSNAGKGDPYWYEWTVGLLKVVEMLQPDSEIRSVSFQVSGIKGWDDVVVQFANRKREFIQAKHSRIGDTITFGDLVGVDENGKSLLGELFSAWKKMKLDGENEKCVIYTNRSAGDRVGRSSAGIDRPPLFKFIVWLKSQLDSVADVKNFYPPDEWRAAWSEWLGQLNAGSEIEQLRFLKSLEVRANQEELLDLEKTVVSSLADVFQIPLERARPLMQALDSALRRWTTTHEKVTAEDVFDAMALDDDLELEHRAPPPPAPFFQSRQKSLDQIESSLRDRGGPPILFLCAEPGAGKTSLISQLVNRRVVEALHGTIALRYFAFRPITPESPLVPPDADYFIQADRLWFSFLSQLRAGLRGKLREYQVPLRNILLTWNEARSHVLRIAKRLGGEMEQPFVIAIDGIDHAARAMRYENSQAKHFFSSLPSPTEIGESPIRILLAGQPADSYPEYPSWLQSENSQVKKLSIGQLEGEDILSLLRNVKGLIPVSQEGAVVEVISRATGRNTLAVVFAVEESRTCNSVAELYERLTQRKLEEGLQEYYNSIWRHALTHIERLPIGAEIALASALCLTSERITGTLMTSAFGSLGLSCEQWNILIGFLGPLVVLDPDGFRVLHNDVRVSLHGMLASKPEFSRRQGASMLADHYMKPSSDRWFSHKSLRRLLSDAGRGQEWAKVFSVDWILEAISLDIPYEDLSDDCVEALQQGVLLKDWTTMVELACATEILERWEERCLHDPIDVTEEHPKTPPAFLHTEAFVKPISEWIDSDLTLLIRDAECLLDSGEIERASGLLRRWLEGLTIDDLCDSVDGIVDEARRFGGDEPTLGLGVNQLLESLGSVCRAVRLNLECKTENEPIYKQASLHFEMGWIYESCSVGSFDSIETCFNERLPRYFSAYKAALWELSIQEHWPLVRRLLNTLEKSQDRLPHDFRLQAAWWALRSEASVDEPKWLDVLRESNFGFAGARVEDLLPALTLCKALNWNDASLEPSATADRVFNALQLDFGRKNS